MNGLARSAFPEVGPTTTRILLSLDTVACRELKFDDILLFQRIAERKQLLVTTQHQFRDTLLIKVTKLKVMTTAQGHDRA